MKKALEIVLVTVMVIGMIGGLLSCFTFGQKRAENERNKELLEKKGIYHNMYTIANRRDI